MLSTADEVARALAAVTALADTSATLAERLADDDALACALVSRASFWSQGLAALTQYDAGPADMVAALLSKPRDADFLARLAKRMAESKVAGQVLGVKSMGAFKAHDLAVIATSSVCVANLRQSAPAKLTPLAQMAPRELAATVANMDLRCTPKKELRATCRTVEDVDGALELARLLRGRNRCAEVTVSSTFLAAYADRAAALMDAPLLVHCELKWPSYHEVDPFVHANAASADLACAVTRRPTARSCSIVYKVREGFVDFFVVSFDGATSGLRVCVCCGQYRPFDTLAARVVAFAAKHHFGSVSVLDSGDSHLSATLYAAWQLLRGRNPPTTLGVHHHANFRTMKRLPLTRIAAVVPDVTLGSHHASWRSGGRLKGGPSWDAVLGVVTELSVVLHDVASAVLLEQGLDRAAQLRSLYVHVVGADRAESGLIAAVGRSRTLRQFVLTRPDGTSAVPWGAVADLIADNALLTLVTMFFGEKGCCSFSHFVEGCIRECDGGVAAGKLAAAIAKNTSLACLRLHGLLDLAGRGSEIVRAVEASSTLTTVSLVFAADLHVKHHHPFWAVFSRPGALARASFERSFEDYRPMCGDLAIRGALHAKGTGTTLRADRVARDIAKWLPRSPACEYAAYRIASMVDGVRIGALTDTLMALVDGEPLAALPVAALMHKLRSESACNFPAEAVQRVFVARLAGAAAADGTSPALARALNALHDALRDSCAPQVPASVRAGARKEWTPLRVYVGRRWLTVSAAVVRCARVLQTLHDNDRSGQRGAAVLDERMFSVSVLRAIGSTCTCRCMHDDGSPEPLLADLATILADLPTTARILLAAAFIDAPCAARCAAAHLLKRAVEDVMAVDAHVLDAARATGCTKLVDTAVLQLVAWAGAEQETGRRRSQPQPLRRSKRTHRQ